MKKVFVAPLDWGLGHATRCIPIINYLQYLKCEVVIGGSGESFALLKAEFPSLLFFELPAYSPRYAIKDSMVGAMIKQLPKFIKVIKKEHEVLKKIINEYNLDLIISDNRYGCWSGVVPSVFVTHQTNVLLPTSLKLLQPFLRYIIQRQIKKYTTCWIPDYPGKDSLSGNLSWGANYYRPRDVTFIGPLSRFTSGEVSDIKYDLVVLCSGPEPQRTIFEKLLKGELEKLAYNYLIVRGVPHGKQCYERCGSRGEIINFLTTKHLESAIRSANIIVSRSGYSTIMDMQALKKKYVIFIPTPGQTEQEYLAMRLEQKGIAFYAFQKQFDLEIAIEKSKNYTGFTDVKSTDHALAFAIMKLVDV